MKTTFVLPLPPPRAPLPFGRATPWLAPLAGYSDLPFRLLCRHYGAAACETEMVSARGLLYKSAPTAALLRSTPADTPLVAQLFGEDADCMEQAVLMLRRAGYWAFDCNFGCPARKVMRQGAGAALMADLPRAVAIGRAVLAAAMAKGEDLPHAAAVVGFKMRLAPANGHIELGQQLAEAGAAWLTLHPRAAADGFGGQARWDEIARLKDVVPVPVLASGDLHNATAAAACLAESGADGVMYARGALRNPAVFCQHARVMQGLGAEPPTAGQMAAMIRLHVDLARQTAVDERAFRKMRSILPRYARGAAGINELRQNLMACASWEDLYAALAKFPGEEA